MALSSDAPYADLDPWRTVAAAVGRTTQDGTCLGPSERVTPGVALDGLLAPLSDPGGAPRSVAVGAPADLCLAVAPFGGAADVEVRATIAAGELTYDGR